MILSARGGYILRIPSGFINRIIDGRANMDVVMDKEMEIGVRNPEGVRELLG